jgi:hypothetical protein
LLRIELLRILLQYSRLGSRAPKPVSAVRVPKARGRPRSAPGNGGSEPVGFPAPRHQALRPEPPEWSLLIHVRRSARANSYDCM